MSTSICSACIHRFRRVFLPLNPEDYEVEGDVEADTSIIISNTCLMYDGVDPDMEDTVDCSHYKKRGGKNPSLIRGDILG